MLLNLSFESHNKKDLNPTVPACQVKVIIGDSGLSCSPPKC